MRDWTKYDKGAIFRDKSKDGLLSQFLKEYSEEFGCSVCASCVNKLEYYYQQYIKSITMSNKIECDYELHAKYNGINIGTNGQPIRNGEMTNEIAKELLEKHPHGAKLFFRMPEIVAEEQLKEEIKVAEAPKEIQKPLKKRK